MDEHWPDTAKVPLVPPNTWRSEGKCGRRKKEKKKFEWEMLDGGI